MGLHPPHPPPDSKTAPRTLRPSTRPSTLRTGVLKGGSMLGEQLKHIRTTRGLSLRQLSIYSGIPASNLNQIELNHISPTWSRIERILEGLNITPVELFLPEEFDSMLKDLAKRPVYFKAVRDCWWFHYSNQGVIHNSERR